MSAPAAGREGKEGAHAPLLLLIDPHRDTLEICRTIFERNGCRVLEARGPGEGVEMARVRRPDVVVTEVFERTARGWAIVETLRGDPGTAELPIVVLSAYALEEDRARALRAGASAFLAKPVVLEELVEAVRRLCAPAEE